MQEDNPPEVLAYIFYETSDIKEMFFLKNLMLWNNKTLKEYFMKIENNLDIFHNQF